MIDDADMEQFARRVETSLAEVRGEVEAIREQLARVAALQEALLREAEVTNQLLRSLRSSTA